MGGKPEREHLDKDDLRNRLREEAEITFHRGIRNVSPTTKSIRIAGHNQIPPAEASKALQGFAQLAELGDTNALYPLMENEALAWQQQGRSMEGNAHLIWATVGRSLLHRIVDDQEDNTRYLMAAGGINFVSLQLDQLAANGQMICLKRNKA